MQFDREIRRVLRTTNTIESVNARINLLHEQVGLRFVYLAVMTLDPTSKARPAAPNAGR